MADNDGEWVGYVELDPDDMVLGEDGYEYYMYLPDEEPAQTTHTSWPPDEQGAGRRRLQSTSDKQQAKSMDELLELFESQLEAPQLDPLGAALLRSDLDAEVFSSFMQQVTDNIEAALARVGTSMTEVWQTLAQALAQAGAAPRMSGQSKSSASSSTAHTQPSNSSTGGSNAAAETDSGSSGSNSSEPRGGGSSTQQANGRSLLGIDEEDSTAQKHGSSNHTLGAGASPDWVRATVDSVVRTLVQPGQEVDEHMSAQIIAQAVLGVLEAGQLHAKDHAGTPGVHNGTNHHASPPRGSTQDESSGEEEEEGTGSSGGDETHMGVDDESSGSRPTQGRRRLQQLTAPTGRIASAFRLVFGNFLDLLNGGGRYWATVLTNLAAFFLNNNLVRELSFYPEAWLNDFVDTNQVPVPASNAAALALLVAVLQGYCTLQSVGAAAQVLGSVTAPSLVITLVPATCPVTEDEDTGKRSISWADCSPAQLTIRTTPWQFNAPFVTGTSFTAGYCRYEYFLGTDSTYSFGGGNAGFTLRRSTRGFQILPVINQLTLVARIAPYIFPQAQYAYGNISGALTYSLNTGYGLGEAGVLPPIGLIGGGAASGVPGGVVARSSNTGTDGRAGTASAGLGLGAAAGGGLPASSAQLQPGAGISGHSSGADSSSSGNEWPGMQGNGGSSGWGSGADEGELMQSLFPQDGSLWDPSVTPWDPQHAGVTRAAAAGATGSSGSGGAGAGVDGRGGRGSIGGSYPTVGSGSVGGLPGTLRSGSAGWDGGLTGPQVGQASPSSLPRLDASQAASAKGAIGQAVWDPRKGGPVVQDQPQLLSAGSSQFGHRALPSLQEQPSLWSYRDMIQKLVAEQQEG